MKPHHTSLPGHYKFLLPPHFPVRPRKCDIHHGGQVAAIERFNGIRLQNVKLLPTDMTGHIDENGVFHADELLLKCPTRYEEAVPEQAASK